MSTPEYGEIVSLNAPDIISLVTHAPVQVCNELRAAELVPEELRNWVLSVSGVSDYKLASKIICCVTDSIKHSGPDQSKRKFLKFVEVLKKADPYFKGIVNRLTDVAVPHGDDRQQVETLDLFQLCSGHCDGSEICQHLATLDEMKVDPNIYDLNGNTPLWLASFYGRHLLVVLLIYHHARPDLPNLNEWRDTALIAASVRGHSTVLDFLIKLYASKTVIDYQNKYGHHSLYGASFKGYIQVVKTLLDHGAQVDLPTDDDLGLTALHAATQEGHLHVADALIDEGANLHHQDKDGQHSLWKASFDGNEDVVEHLLKRGANVDQPTDDEYGSTALEIACQKGHEIIADKLLMKGANVDYQNKKGHHSLYKASYYGYVRIVKLLLRYKAVVDLPTKDDLGFTALLVSCQEGHAEVAQVLIDEGAEIDYCNESGTSSLYMASQEGNTEVIKVLLDYGAVVDIQTEDGSTPLTIASEQGHIEVVEILVCKGASVNNQQKDGWAALHFAGAYGHHKLMILLIHKGANVDIQTESGNTVLCCAAYKGDYQTVEILLKAGANLDIQDKDGLTPLMLASKLNHADIVSLLIRGGVELDLTEKNCGWTALFFASKEGNVEVVELLLQAGACVDVKDYNQVTALTLAQFHPENDDISQLLLKYSSTSTDGTLTKNTSTDNTSTESVSTENTSTENTSTEQEEIMRMDRVKECCRRLRRIFDVLEDSLLPGRREKRKKAMKKPTSNNQKEAEASVVLIKEE